MRAGRRGGRGKAWRVSVKGQMENSGTLPSKHGTRGRLHKGDSLEYEVVGISVANQVLSDWGGAPDSHSDAILLYRSDVSIAGPVEPTMVVIDGAADVAGCVSVDDPCALFVRGRLRCTSFWVHDAEVRIGELEVEVAAFEASRKARSLSTSSASSRPPSGRDQQNWMRLTKLSFRRLSRPRTCLRSWRFSLSSKGG